MPGRSRRRWARPSRSSVAPLAAAPAGTGKVPTPTQYLGVVPAHAPARISTPRQRSQQEFLPPPSDDSACSSSDSLMNDGQTAEHGLTLNGVFGRLVGLMRKEITVSAYLLGLLLT